MKNKENFKITKINKLLEINNDMTHNYYYIAYGKIYNNEHNKFRKFKFIVYFDIFDLQEYFEKDVISKEDIKNYANDYIFGECLNYQLDDDCTYYSVDRLKKFFQFCCKTIENYNNIL